MVTVVSGLRKVPTHTACSCLLMQKHDKASKSDWHNFSLVCSEESLGSRVGQM